MTSDWPKLAKEIRENIIMKRITVSKKAATKSVSIKTTAKASSAASSMSVAAAEKAAAEIAIWVQSQTEPLNEEFEVKPMAYVATVNTSAGWRKVSLNNGHRLTWKGDVRASARGNILFAFVPEMNSELENRGATVVEIPHDELDTVLGDQFSGWLATEMGVSSVQELVDQARTALDPVEVANAEAKLQAAKEAEEQKRIAEENKKLEANPMFGAWA